MTVARRKSLKWPLYAAILILVAVSAAFMVLARKYTGDTIRKGIIIENTDVSWLSSGDARRIVEDTLKKNYAGDRLILTYGGRKWDIRLSDIDYRFEVDRAVEKAFSIGREGNVFRKLLDSVILARNGLKLDVEVSFSREKLRSILEEIKKSATHMRKTHRSPIQAGSYGIPAKCRRGSLMLTLISNWWKII